MKSTPAKNWEVKHGIIVCRDSETAYNLVRMKNPPKELGGMNVIVGDFKVIKAEVITQAKAERDGEILTMIEGMVVEIPSQVSNPDWGKGYNQALSDLKSTIERDK